MKWADLLPGDVLFQKPWPGEGDRLFLVLENNLPSEFSSLSQHRCHVIRLARLEDGSVALWQVGARVTLGYGVMRSGEIMAEMKEPGYVAIHEIVGQ